MLRELPNVMQVPGEPRRRWFFCHDIDLVVWEDPAGAVCGFQLAYDKQRSEHSLSWDRERGFAHYVVDNGEPMALANETPFLYLNGPFGRDRVLEQFRAVAQRVPAAIAAFVEGKLGEFDGPLLD